MLQVHILMIPFPWSVSHRQCLVPAPRAREGADGSDPKTQKYTSRHGKACLEMEAKTAFQYKHIHHTPSLNIQYTSPCPCLIFHSAAKDRAAGPSSPAPISAQKPHPCIPFIEPPGLILWCSPAAAALARCRLCLCPYPVLM